MKDLIKKFAELKGAKFVGISGYTSKSTGEVSNIVINTNISVENAKKKDLLTLQNFPASKLNEIALKVGATKEVALLAIEEMIVSAEKNLSADNRTAQSQAQTDAYTHITNGIKFHNETGDLYVTGFAKSKTVLVEGEHKVVKSNPKTLVKKEVSKVLKMYKFRTFKLSNVSEKITMTGSTLQVS